MSIVAMNWAWDVKLDYLGERDNKAGRRLLLVALGDNANEDGVCWPAISTLARRCESSTKSVRRWLHEFEQYQLVTISPRRNAEGQTSNLYQLHLSRKAAEKRPETPNEEITPPDSESRGGVDTESGGDGLGDQGPRTPGDQGPRTPEVPLTTSEPPLNPSHSGAGEPDVFERAAQQTDNGQPLATTQRQQPMTLDWEPDLDVWQRACFDRGLPPDVDVHQALIDFREHFAAQPGRIATPADWTRRFARWVHENLKRQQAQAAITGGATHANRRERTPARRLTAAEARERDRIARAGGGQPGDVFPGEYTARAR